ncbi:uncharacterized protein CC84DRAFT_495544 [Paraphaeosphaeria sporulosa]|uniref:Uncharacterized protein n=1 Tax=Paraphaeosphaeria sporulosa TaxID=1460663 RepID=A0A177CVH3_9PLEO|nr:uncharacterized protein CC84DRAFT_495544 [Paraphaeosphaeria sporulosa]OAG10787.1 hypothetical protein CC84DRAFT_495544 [Paraphaeosphaeria sporulosa]
MHASPASESRLLGYRNAIPFARPGTLRATIANVNIPLSARHPMRKQPRLRRTDKFARNDLQSPTHHHLRAIRTLPLGCTAPAHVLLAMVHARGVKDGGCLRRIGPRLSAARHCVRRGGLHHTRNGAAARYASWCLPIAILDDYGSLNLFDSSDKRAILAHGDLPAMYACPATHIKSPRPSRKRSSLGWPRRGQACGRVLR